MRTNDLVEFCTQQTGLELNPVHESGAKYRKLYVTKFFIDLSEVLEGGGGIVMDVPLFNSRRESVPNILSKIVACMHLLLCLCTMYIIV